MRDIPERFDRCVKHVTASLEKYGKDGSPYAICKSRLKEVK